MSNSVLDDAIRAIFEEYQSNQKLSVDDILVNPQEAAQFAQLVNCSLSPDKQLPVPTVLRRLITLRKLGEKNGGLPRGERIFRGRNAK